MPPDWADPTIAMARQYPAPPGVIITPGMPAQMRVGGRLVPAMPADAASYPAGTQVKPIQLGADWLFLPSTSKYPASYLEPLANWAAKSREALFLKYVLEQSNCQKLRIYSRGRVVSVLSQYQLIVACWDGITRTLPVDYMGQATTGAFRAGDRCLVYDSAASKIIIGFANDTPRSNGIQSVPGIYEVTVALWGINIEGSNAYGPGFKFPFPTLSSEYITHNTPYYLMNEDGHYPFGNRYLMYGDLLQANYSNYLGQHNIPYNIKLELKVSSVVEQIIIITPISEPYYSDPSITLYKSDEIQIYAPFRTAWINNPYDCDIVITYE